MKHPKQLRVTFKEQLGYHVAGDKKDVPLGFAQIYEPHLKSFEKKKQTQDDWAYGASSWGRKFFYRDDKVWTCRWVYEGQSRSEVEAVVPDELQPRIIDNVPLIGFKVQHSVSRYSTSNKLWRILDPRGFELEMPTGDFAALLSTVTIDHGLIIEPCIWHTGKILVRCDE